MKWGRLSSDEVFAHSESHHLIYEWVHVRRPYRKLPENVFTTLRLTRWRDEESKPFRFKFCLYWADNHLRLLKLYQDATEERQATLTGATYWSNAEGRDMWEYFPDDQGRKGLVPIVVTPVQASNVGQGITDVESTESRSTISRPHASDAYFDSTITPSCRIHALGVILYQVGTGEIKDFDCSPSAVEVAAKELEKNDRLLKLEATMSLGFCMIVQKVMQWELDPESNQSEEEQETKFVKDVLSAIHWAVQDRPFAK